MTVLAWNGREGIQGKRWMEEIQHLAKLAYQNGEKSLQAGWWEYVKARARELEIPLTDLLAEIERQKSLNVLKKGGDCERV